MIVERSMSPEWLSNTYLVAAEEGGDAFFVDAGGPVAPLLEAAERLRLRPTHVLLTHRHHDHVAELGALPGGLEVFSHPDERVDGVTGELPEELEIGGLRVRALPTPGHTSGMLSLYVDDSAVFTGDTLFKNSVGGVRAPGHTSYEDIKHSIMEVLLALPPDTVIYPGHTDATTVRDEWESNSFVRIWRGLDPEGSDPITVWDQRATLIHLGDDYDGGHKAWIRWADGSDDIVPGSQVQR